MTDTTGNDVVDAALDRLARTDRQEAEAARAAFASLTWGGGPDSVTLYELCDWLWYRLPAKWMCGLPEHMQLACALGALFGLLEMPRYARMCTSETTANVLAAWDRDRKEGMKAMAAARAASGVSPPDIPGLLTWGEVMGTEENSALFATATRLEMMIAAGEFRPGARGWRKAAERAAATFLVTPRDDLSGNCWLQRIHAERLQEWTRSRGSPRGPLAEALASQLARPAAVPRQAAELLAPVTWLLGKATDDGAIPLTQSHTLARAVVAEGCQRFGWLTLTGRPRSESDIVEAWTLRTMIRELGAVRRQGRQLYLTPAGKNLAAASAVGTMVGRGSGGAAHEQGRGRRGRDRPHGHADQGRRCRRGSPWHRGRRDGRGRLALPGQRRAHRFRRRRLAARRTAAPPAPARPPRTAPWPHGRPAHRGRQVGGARRAACPRPAPPRPERNRLTAPPRSRTAAQPFGMNQPERLPRIRQSMMRDPGVAPRDGTVPERLPRMRQSIDAGGSRGVAPGWHVPERLPRMRQSIDAGGSRAPGMAPCLNGCAACALPASGFAARAGRIDLARAACCHGVRTDTVVHPDSVPEFSALILM